MLSNINPWYMLTLTLDSLPFSIILFCVFKDRLRYNLTFSILIATLADMAYDLVVACMQASGRFSGMQLIGMRLGTLFVGLSLKFLIFKGFKYKNIYLAFSCLPYMIIILSMSALFIGNIDTTRFPEYMPISLFRLGFTLILAYPIYVYWKNFLYPSIDIDNPRIWTIVTVIQFILNVGICSNLRTDYYSNGIESTGMVLFVTMLIASVSVCVLFFYSMMQIQSVTKLEEYQKREEMLLGLQQSQYKAINENIEQMRHLRHDMRHHINLVSNLLENDQIEEAKKYIADYNASIPVNSTYLLCSNPAINALLGHYSDMAKESGIDMQISAQALGESTIPDTDMSIVLGNSIENAIEACRAVEDPSQRSIKVAATINGRRIYLTVDNTFNGTIQREGYNFLSSKRDYLTHGYGLSSIEAVAEKYYGQIRTDIKDNIFSLSVMMKM